jgi:HD superfamily phosphodiesterase
MNYIKYSYLETKIEKLKKILEINNISPCHGIIHALAVLDNAIIALSEYNLSDENIKCLLFAALLHDADDKKFFPNNNNLDNLRNILCDEQQIVIDNVVKMVNLVSSSKNGDNIPENTEEWMLIPRYCDRLEAIGIIGITRLLIYTIYTNTKIYVEDTPRPKSIDEIYKYASIERYNKYKGNSNSLFDHCFDKLLRFSNFPIKNKFLNDEAIKRIKYIIDFVLLFGSYKINTIDDIKIYIYEHDQNILNSYMCA